MSQSEPQRGTARGQPGRHVDPCPYVCMAQKENDMTTVALKHASEQAQLDDRLDLVKPAPLAAVSLTAAVGTLLQVVGELRCRTELCGVPTR